MKRNISANQLRHLYRGGAIVVLLVLLLATVLRSHPDLNPIARMSWENICWGVAICLFLLWQAHRHVQVSLDDVNLYVRRRFRAVKIPVTLIAAVKGIRTKVSQSDSTWRIRLSFKETTPIGDDLVFGVPPDKSTSTSEHPLVAELRRLAGLPTEIRKETQGDAPDADAEALDSEAVPSDEQGSRFSPREVLWLGAVCLVGLPGSLFALARMWKEGPLTVGFFFAAIVGLFTTLMAPLLVFGCTWDFLSGRERDRRQLLGGLLAAGGIGLAILALLTQFGSDAK